MATTKKQKTFYYKRGYVDIPKGKRGYQVSLEQLLIQAHASPHLSTTAKRSFTTPAGELQCPRFEQNINGLRIHLTLAKLGGAASTVPKKGAAKASRLASIAPPQNYDFLSGDVIALIKENNIITCTTRIRDSILAQYARWALDQASILDEKFLPANSDKLKISNISDINKINQIKKEGVSEIILSSSLYAATKMNGDGKSEVGTLLHSAVEKIQLIFSKDDEPEEIDALENLNVNVSIKFDGKKARSKTRPAHLGDKGNNHLIAAAEKLLEKDEAIPEESEFTIITKKNTRISSDEIKICAPRAVAELGNSIDPHAAWSLMESYMNELLNSGLTCN